MHWTLRTDRALIKPDDWTTRFVSIDVAVPDGASVPVLQHDAPHVVLVELQLAAGMDVEVLQPFPIEHDRGRGRVRVLLGNVSSGSPVILPLAVRFAPRKAGGVARLCVRIDADGAEFEPALREVTWRYAPNDGTVANDRDAVRPPAALRRGAKTS